MLGIAGSVVVHTVLGMLSVEDEGWQYVWMLQRGDETLRGGRALSADGASRQASHALCQPG